MTRSKGKVKLRLLDANNEFFNEYPFYTKMNFMLSTISDQDAENFMTQMGQLVSLTNNTAVDVSVEYTVKL